MRVRVCFVNPISGAPPYVEFNDVQSIKHEHGELVLIRSSSNMPTIFASRQWVWIEPIVENRLNDQESWGRAVYDQKEQYQSARRPSDLNDLVYATPEVAAQTAAARVQFAIGNRMVPWSEADMKAVLDYEDQIRQEYGEPAVQNLPWRKVPRGSDR